MNNPNYVLSSGDAGRERLRILARVMERGTRSLLDKASVSPGQACLDVACGGGDVSQIFADQVGPTGRVVGVDLDVVKLEIARNEARNDASLICRIKRRMSLICHSNRPLMWSTADSLLPTWRIRLQP